MRGYGAMRSGGRSESYLFSEGLIFGVFDARRAQLRQEIEKLPDDALLARDVETHVAYFADHFRLLTPTLHEDQKSLEQQEQVVQREDPFGRPICEPVTIVTVFIPFSGHGNLFRATPSRRSSRVPQGKVQDSHLTLTFECSEGHSRDRLKVEIDARLAEIREYLSDLGQDIEKFNASLPGEARPIIEQRRQLREKQLGVVASLGIPLRRRSDVPPVFAVPAARRKVTVQASPKPIARAAKPEPTLESRHYEDILAVITDAGKAIERSPRAFRTMGEEDLRWLLLIPLNALFEGNVTGETFNFTGKTDILIRWEEKNVFIAECKFWGGPKTLTDAVDQILGYASWRDTKIALVIFNRRKNLTALLDKIVPTIAEHPAFARRLEDPSNTSFRFILHHRDDPARELTLTVLVFEVPLEELGA